MTKSKLILCNENKLLQEEKERLRKLRLIQVREISKQNAALVREAFRKEKQKEIKTLYDKHQQAKKQEIQENFDEVKQLVQSQLDNIGKGHLSAANYDDQSELKMQLSIENNQIAQIRGRVAQEIYKEEKNDKENKENAHIISRKFALEQEKIRSAQIAKLPKPVDQLENVITNANKPIKLVSLHDADVFMTTRYHMPDTIVDKAETVSGVEDARQDAIDESIRLKMLEQDQNRTSQERMEKARLRGKHALEKEILNENYNEILHDLSLLQQADREKRQKELINIPKEIFLPSWQREQNKNEMQLNMERQFEKIYVDSNLRKEEVPQPIDLKQLEIESQSNFEDADLDLTLLDDINNLNEISKRESIEYQQKVNSIEQINNGNTITVVTMPTSTVKTTSDQTTCADSLTLSNATQSQPENTTLNKLLDKIRKQREEYVTKSNKIQNVSIESTSCNTTGKKLNQLPDDENPITNQDTSLFSITESDKSTNSEHKLTRKSEDQTNLEETTDDESFLSSCSSVSIAEIDVSQTRVDANLQEQNKIDAKKEKKIIRGIMMSSHNVSSINEIDSNRMLLNAKIISANNRRINSNDQVDAPQVNTATYSVDLSHASRDPMIAAGPSEEFNKNDVKLAIEIKQKKLQKQQMELEKKLKDLELQEAELEREQLVSNIEIKNKPSGSLVSGPVDSGIDHNCVDSNGNSSFLTSTNSIQTQNTNQKSKISIEELKRIEYQNKILNMVNNSKSKEDESSSATSSSSCLIDSCSQKQIEERKKEILKRFGIDQVQINSKKSSTTSSLVSSAKQLNQIQSDDKNTVCSVDSGFSSGLVASSNYFNNNYRPQINNQILKQQQKKPINLEVEQLNSEIINATNANGSTTKQPYMSSYQSQLDMIDYLKGNINEEEYKKRLSSSSGASSGMMSLSNYSIQDQQHRQNKQFGLEFFDSNNLNDIRDVSLEKFIGLAASSKQLQQEQLQTMNNVHDKQLSLSNSNSENKSSSMFSKKISISIGSSSSSNDTSNDEDDVECTSNSISSNSNLENTLSKTEDGEEDDDDSQALIMSLLNSRQNNNIVQNQLSKPKEMSFIDLKRQFIQSQLEAVRKQKEKLHIQNLQVNQQQQHQPQRAFSHNVLNMPPTIKVHKLMGNTNLHELSTIKEVDTPKSEKNLKLNNKNSSINKSNANINLNDMSISMAFSNSSLENVTQLSDRQQPHQSSTNILGTNFHNETVLSNSPSTFSTSSDYSENRNENFSKKSNDSSHSMQTLSNNTINESLRILTSEEMRQKQKNLFNLSLFDSSISNSSSLPSPLMNSNEAPVNISNNMNKQNLIEYGALIYDSLLTNNLTDFASIQTTQNLTNSIQQTPTLIKSEQSQNLNNMSATSSQNSLNMLNSHHKKWFDILASSSLSVDKNSDKSSQATLLSMNNSNIKTTPFITSNNNLNLTEDPALNETSLNSLTQHSFSDYSLNIASKKQDNKSIILEKTLPIYNSPPKVKNKQSIHNSPPQMCKNDSLTNKNELRKDTTNLSVMNSMHTNTFNQTSINNTSSGVAMGSLNSNSSNNNNSSGLFDRFLKNYNSGSSVMDEPELSFVSYQSNSNSNSPTRFSMSKANNSSRNKINESSFPAQSRTNLSIGTSGCESNSSNSINTTDSSNTSLSLIQFQQKQLNKQFCNVSPIDQNLSNRMNNLKCQSFSATISFEQTLGQKHFDEINVSENNGDNLEACSKQSSFILLSPNKINDDKAGSLIHGLIDDENEQTLSTSLIESQLNFPFNCNSLNHFKNNKININDYKDSSSVEKYSDSNLKNQDFSLHTISNSSDSRTNTKFEISQNSENKPSNTNILTCVTSFLSTNTTSNSGDQSKKSNSLISFEQHEASSNQSKLKQEDTECYNLSAIDDFSTSFNENSTNSKFLLVKNRIEKSKLDISQEKKFPNFNSTPLIALRQSSNSVLSPSYLSSFGPIKESDEKFQSFIENIDCDETTTSNSLGLCNDIKNFNLNETCSDHSKCDNLSSNENTNLTITSQK